MGSLPAWCACAGDLRGRQSLAEDPFFKGGGGCCCGPAEPPRDIAGFQVSLEHWLEPLPPVASVPHWTGASSRQT